MIQGHTEIQPTAHGQVEQRNAGVAIAGVRVDKGRYRVGTSARERRLPWQRWTSSDRPVSPLRSGCCRFNRIGPARGGRLTPGLSLLVHRIHRVVVWRRIRWRCRERKRGSCSLLGLQLTQDELGVVRPDSILGCFIPAGVRTGINCTWTLRIIGWLSLRYQTEPLIRADSDDAKSLGAARQSHCAGKHDTDDSEPQLVSHDQTPLLC